MRDGWSNIRHEPIINFLLRVPQSVFWKSIHTELQSHTGEYIAEEVSGVTDEFKQECGNMPIALVTENASNQWSRTLGSRPRTQNKFEAKAKDSFSEDRPSRGQEQKCSRPRPRTKDTAASVLQKKRSSKKFFRQSPVHRRNQNF